MGILTIFSLCITINPYYVYSYRTHVGRHVHRIPAAQKPFYLDTQRHHRTWILLFLLGVEVGGNRQIIEGLATIGLEAFVITLAAILGSCICAWALWYLLYKRKGGRA